MSRESGVSGASTDQHVDGPDETGTFTTDEEPAADTPASGSSNAGINRLHANRPPSDPGDDDERR
ncbi:hypothetical protein Acy02nite_49010 [Actinoplanes cyaneus]|jgi:hypothetical protein|uniref:Uncharacterized protein n=1 Tax=Actinoplanes cyaneus TaxID=52696 RepID=A0A919IJ64_9ACTN|nr:hypothetical protein [Actinoplanes cyaneus]MCW2143183.1 hypothetical protein [Actinoplanes cyaneus]GID67020.1 hypothetical protein Acy02nite_49010 [Actinoplanes cyaneus]